MQNCEQNLALGMNLQSLLVSTWCSRLHGVLLGNSRLTVAVDFWTCLVFTDTEHARLSDLLLYMNKPQSLWSLEALEAVKG